MLQVGDQAGLVGGLQVGVQAGGGNLQALGPMEPGNPTGGRECSHFFALLTPVPHLDQKLGQE